MSRARQPEHRPGALQRMLIEEFDGAQSDGDVGAREFALIGEVEKVLANLLLSELIGRLPVMSGQEFYRRDVGSLGGESEAVELQIFNETLTERGHGILSGKAGSNIHTDGPSCERSNLSFQNQRPTNRLRNRLEVPYPAGAGFSSIN